MNKSDKLAFCCGCDSDFYNDHNGIGVKECWHLKRAKAVNRWKLAWWTTPDIPGAYQEVRTLDCHTESGKFAFHKDLPTFAVDPIKLKKEKEHALR